MGVLAECARSGVGCSGVGWSGVEDCSVLFQCWKFESKIGVLLFRCWKFESKIVVLFVTNHSLCVCVAFDFKWCFSGWVCPEVLFHKVWKMVEKLLCFCWVSLFYLFMANLSISSWVLPVEFGQVEFGQLSLAKLSLASWVLWSWVWPVEFGVMLD